MTYINEKFFRWYLYNPVIFPGEDNGIIYIATKSTLTMLCAMQGKFSREEGFLVGDYNLEKMGLGNLLGKCLKWNVLLISFYVELSWTQGVKHFDRILLAAFVLVNGLNPVGFMEWADLLNLCNDGAARRHFEALFCLLPERNYTLYAYNVTNNRYEYLDGRVRRYVHVSRRNQ